MRQPPSTGRRIFYLRRGHHPMRSSADSMQCTVSSPADACYGCMQTQYETNPVRMQKNCRLPFWRSVTLPSFILSHLLFFRSSVRCRIQVLFRCPFQALLRASPRPLRFSLRLYSYVTPSDSDLLTHNVQAQPRREAASAAAVCWTSRIHPATNVRRKLRELRSAPPNMVPRCL
jgi:hypothetical protein